MRKRRVIFATPILRYPPLGGPELRIDSTIKALSQISEVHLYSTTGLDMAVGELTRRFYERYAEKVYVAPSGLREYRWRRFLRRGTNFLSRRLFGRLLFDPYAFRGLANLAVEVKPDVIWLGFGNISYSLLKYLKKRHAYPVVLDTDSVWSRFILRGLPYASTKEQREAIEAQGLEKVEEEKWGTALADVTTAVSEVDAQYYRSLAKTPDQIRIFCNAIDIGNYWLHPPAPVGLRTPCLFLGGSFYPRSPMEDAARWMIEDIFPLIQREIPDVHLYVVGKDSDRVMADVVSPQITVTGTVSSVLPYLYHASAALVPLRFESGTRFKILEAGACGIPVVSTTLGAEGLSLKHGEHIIIGDDAGTFAKGVTDILKDRNMATRLGQNLKELVHANYSVESLARQAEQILEFVSS